MLLLHENDEANGGCPFARFFETTPQDLINPPKREGLPKEKGLYSQLALAAYSGPFWTVSVALVAKFLGARRFDGLHCRRTQVRHLLPLISCPPLTPLTTTTHYAY